MKFFVATAFVATLAVASAQFNGCARGKFGVYANPTDCAKFVMCVSGAPVTMACPRGMNFDSRIATCSPFAKCNTVPVVEDPVHEEPHHEEPHHEEPHHEEPHHEEPIEEPHHEEPHHEEPHHEEPIEEPKHEEPETPVGFACPRSNGRFIDTEKCGQYYVCKEGKATHFRCPFKLNFSSKWGMCMPGVKCVQAEEPVPEEPHHEEPHHEEPHHEEPHHEEPHHEEPHHEEPIEEPKHEEPVEEPTVPAKFTCKKSFGLFADADDCHKYHMCVRGRAFTIVCPTNSNYDFVNKHCMTITKARCMKKGGDEKIEEEEPIQEEKKFECPVDFGFFPSSAAGKFVQCSNGVAHEMQCPAGTEWSQEAQACDHIRTVA